MLRLGLGRAIPIHWGTFAANALACLALGILSARLRAAGADAHENWRLLVGVGFCGGLSTFSTLMLEMVGFGERGMLGQGAGHLLLSVAAGVGALLLGRWVGV